MAGLVIPGDKCVWKSVRWKEKRRTLDIVTKDLAVALRPSFSETLDDDDE